jgi:hypothetical protein
MCVRSFSLRPRAFTGPSRQWRPPWATSAIDEKEFVSVGGIDQRMVIRGRQASAEDAELLAFLTPPSHGDREPV